MQRSFILKKPLFPYNTSHDLIKEDQYNMYTSKFAYGNSNVCVFFKQNFSLLFKVVQPINWHFSYIL